MSRTHILLSVLVALLLIAAFYLLAWSPKSDELAEVESQIEQVESDQQRLSTEIARLRGVRAEAPEIESELAAGRSLLPTDMAVAASLRQLQTAADESGIEIAAVSPGRPEPLGEEGPAEGEVAGEVLSSMNLSIQLEGRYFQIVDFLRRTTDPEITPRAVRWESISVSAEERPRLSASIDGRMFAVLPSAPPPAEVTDEPASPDAEAGDAAAEDEAQDADAEADDTEESSASPEDAP